MRGAPIAPDAIVSFIAEILRVEPAHEPDLHQPAAEGGLGVEDGRTIRFRGRGPGFAKDRFAALIAASAIAAVVGPHEATMIASTSLARIGPRRGRRPGRRRGTKRPRSRELRQRR